MSVPQKQADEEDIRDEPTKSHSSFPRWVAALNQPRPIRLGEHGTSAGIAPETVPDMVTRCCLRFGEKVYLCHKPSLRYPVWQTITFLEYLAYVRRAAKALISLGVEPFTGVCISGFNSPEWFIVNNAAIFAGAVSCGIYQTMKRDFAQHILSDCHSSILFVDTRKQLHQICSFSLDSNGSGSSSDSMLNPELQLHHVRTIVQWRDDIDPKDAQNAKSKHIQLLSWEEFLDCGKDVDTKRLQERLNDITPAHCCTLIYTSGTTGPPKGVMTSHDNLTWVAARMALDVMKVNESDYGLSYLPLSHIAANLVELHVSLLAGGTVYFCQPDALQGSLIHTIREVRPSLFLGVPRVYERMMEGARSIADNQPGIVQSIGSWAKNTAVHGNLSLMEGDDSKPWGWWLANSVILNLVRSKLGLDNCRILITAAAPLSPDTELYFLSLNLPLLNIYGCSEVTGPIAVSKPGKGGSRLGSVGSSFDGQDLGIYVDADGELGEICARGRHIFMGYLNDEDASSKAIDANSFYHTGDLGMIDDAGMLYMRGRLKDIIVTAGGENVATLPLEQSILAECGPLSGVEHAMVVGEGKKHLSVIMTLKRRIEDGVIPIDILSGDNDGDDESVLSCLKRSPRLREIHDIVSSAISRANKSAASRAATVKKFALIPYPLTESEGELTATQKVKRNVVAVKYSKIIEEMYASDDVWYQVGPISSISHKEKGKVQTV